LSKVVVTLTVKYALLTLCKDRKYISTKKRAELSILTLIFIIK